MPDVRSTMIGTLLEDLKSGLSVSDVKRRFDEKMNPLKYMRPQAAPSTGQIAAAEKIVSVLESAGSLKRRFARLEDLEKVWKPLEVYRLTPSGVFAHLQPANTEPQARDLGVGPIVMTYEKFARTVLPFAEKIECRVPSGPSQFIAFTTAANPDAPPIIVWDREDRRNPVSWYLYRGGSLAYQWGLTQGAFTEVTAVVRSPSKWDPERDYSNHADMAVFILKGARDLRHTVGGALFPEHMKSDYHGIRSTIEAYSNRAKIGGLDQATACGLALQPSAGRFDYTFRVTSNGVRTLYTIDRWD